MKLPNITSCIILPALALLLGACASSSNEGEPVDVDVSTRPLELSDSICSCNNVASSCTRKVRVFSDINYGGCWRDYCINTVDSVLGDTFMGTGGLVTCDNQYWNKKISSAKVFGNSSLSFAVRLYSENNFGGTWGQFAGNEPDLGDLQMNDFARSLKVVAF